MYNVDYDALGNQVYRALKEMILSGELQPGQKLRQDELAQRLGVSRTPLLSAFSKLERELLVELIPRRGAFVRRFSVDELVHLYDIRLRLEPLGAKEAAMHGTAKEQAVLRELADQFRAAADDGMDNHAAKNMDYALHMHIMMMSRNELLVDIISSYNIIVAVANVYGFMKDPRVSAAEHEQIVAGILGRRPQLALRSMFAHLNTSRRALLEQRDAIVAASEGHR